MASNLETSLYVKILPPPQYNSDFTEVTSKKKNPNPESIFFPQRDLVKSNLLPSRGGLLLARIQATGPYHGAYPLSLECLPWGINEVKISTKVTSSIW